MLRTSCRHIHLKRHEQILNVAQKQRNVHQYSAAAFAELCSKPTSKFQIYSSLSHDPFFNLSVEHYLLQKTPAESTILFFYVNKPCVVIGRNQNPWLEADLKYMATHPIKVLEATSSEGPPGEYLVELVRRRSGGGTVFHDLQNINYSVIRPTSDFSRDKSVEMVVKAIREDNRRARVNERHDIVLDTGPFREKEDPPDLSDMHKTSFASSDIEDGQPLKVSGSAYKLTRNRSLHHGTCLLNSPNLKELSMYLNSPAKYCMKAKGVESVRSPVSNLYDTTIPTNYRSRFEAQVSDVFRTDLCLDMNVLDVFSKDRRLGRLEAKDNWVAATVDQDLAKIPEVKAGMEELMSPEWLYGQTPQFDLTIHISGGDVVHGKSDSYDVRNDVEGSRPPTGIQLELNARSGAIQSAHIWPNRPMEQDAVMRVVELSSCLRGLKIYEVQDFAKLLSSERTGMQKELRALARSLNRVFGINTK